MLFFVCSICKHTYTTRSNERDGEKTYGEWCPLVATSLIFIVAVFGETLAGNVTCKVKMFFMFVTHYCYHCGGGNCVP